MKQVEHCHCLVADEDLLIVGTSFHSCALHMHCLGTALFTRVTRELIALLQCIWGREITSVQRGRAFHPSMGCARCSCNAVKVVKHAESIV